MEAEVGGRRRVPRGEREQLMLEAAEREFGRTGFVATSTDDIASACGVTKALLFRYFGSKEGLYNACMERVRGRLYDGIEEQLAELPPGPARLRAFVDAYFAFLDEHRDQQWLLYSEVSGGTANLLRSLNAEASARMLREGLTARLPETDLTVLAHALVGAGEQVGRWWLASPEVPREEAAARFQALATGLIAGALQEGGA